MKQLLFFLLLLAVPKCGYAQTAKALWCSDQTTLVFVYDDNTYAAGDALTSHGVTYTVSTNYSVYLTTGSATWIANSPYTEVQNNATKVVFDESFKFARPRILRQWFYHFSFLTEVVGMENLNTSEVTDMEGLFRDCPELTSLDVTHWDMKKVKTIQELFTRCTKLDNLDVSGWEFEDLKNMYQAFMGCSYVSQLKVSDWNVSKVTDMGMLFRECSRLTELDVSKWETGKVENMAEVFSGCSNVAEIDVSGWNTESATTMSYMFYHCERVEALDVSNWNTSNVKNLTGTFAQCKKLSSLPVSHSDNNPDVWNTENVTTMKQTFWGCKSLTSLDISNWDTSEVKDMLYIFSDCELLPELDVSKWKTGNVTTMNSAFASCTNLKTIDVSRWETQNVTDFASMFQKCHKLDSLNVKGFNTAKAIKTSDMFWDCRGLKSLTFGEDFSMEKVTNPARMFRDCSKLRYIDFYASNDIDAISSKDRTDPTSRDMFFGVPRTTVIYLPHGSANVSGDTENVVYTDGSELKCDKYYSEDKVDIEFPRDFKTNRAEYSRTMSNTYGSVILPYAFTTNANIQAYTLDDEHPETMYFRDTETVPAHTPFAFKKLGNAEFIMEDATGGFGITVEATRSTNAGEDTWTGSKGTPYTHSENLGGWTTKGYYVSETVDDFDGTFYIAGDKFYKADGALTMYPHRVTFHGTWTKGTPSQDNNGAKFFNIAMGESEVITAIEEAALRKAEREAESIHDMQGRKVSSLQRGLNIVRMSDGTVRKLLRR